MFSSQVKNRTPKPKKKVPVQKISINTEFVDDEDALKQVILAGSRTDPAVLVSMFVRE